MEQISILGCGWLGLPLAKALLKNGFLVSGSTTSIEKLSMLKNAGIQPFLIFLTPALSKGEGEKNIEVFLEGSKTLIIDIPPKLRGYLNENFVGKIENLIPFIEKSTIENVLFVSSTSVYGKTNGAVTEATFPEPDTESGKQLLLAESLLQNNKSFKTTVLRFGGLIGENRHPVKFLAGRKNLENPDAPINLIHQEDCIGIIQKIIETNSWNQIFNAVAPFHPTRKEYYTQKAKELNLDLPEFEESELSNRKIISNTKVEEILNYTFTKTNF